MRRTRILRGPQDRNNFTFTLYLATEKPTEPVLCSQVHPLNGLIKACGKENGIIVFVTW